MIPLMRAGRRGYSLRPFFIAKIDIKKFYQVLDRAVDRIYRLTPFRSGEERLEHLFKLYEEMIQREAEHAKENKRKKRRVGCDEFIALR